MSAFPPLRLVPIDRSGAPEDAGLKVDDVARESCAATAALYRKIGFVRPWLGYLVADGAQVVGICGFAAPPASGRVEIAYFTFPAFEGRGIATSMARALIAMARGAEPAIIITAQTLPKPNASTRVLEKLGFARSGTVVYSEDDDVRGWVLGSRGGAPMPPSPPSRAD